VSSRAASALVVLAPALVACQGETGTIALGLTTAPGSAVLDPVERLQVRLTNPPAVFEATRTDDGFRLAIEVDETDESGALIVNGYDGGGALVATGASPAFPVAAIDARIVVYMATPMSVELAPVSLEQPRTELAAAPLAYGALLAGGRLATGEPSAAISIYNAFDHSLVEGMPMPAARAGLAAGVGPSGRVYLFGGHDAADAPTGTLWRFDTTVPPRGVYAQLGERPELARADQTMVPIGTERFLVSGSPPLEITATSLAPRTDIASLGASGASVAGTDGVPAAVFAGDSGLVRFRAETFTLLDPQARPGARTAALPGGQVLVVDETGAALRVDVATGEVVPLPALVPAACAAPTLAVTSRHLVLGCESSTHVHDVATLEPLATIQRGGSVLAALPNDQVLLASGDALALFTPPPLE